MKPFIPYKQNHLSKQKEATIKQPITITKNNKQLKTT
jgi:hypothetical protein